MRTFPVDPLVLDEKALITQAAPEGPPNIEGPALIRDGATGEPLMLIDRYRGDLPALRWAMRKYPMNTTVRAAGIRNRSNTFGFTAKQVMMQRNVCRTCNTVATHPAEHLELTRAAGFLSAHLEAAIPDLSALDRRRAEEILPEWRMWGTQWTSGVLNETSPLPYHFDRNNLPTWSAMVVVRRGVTGGHLHVPRLGLTVECRDGDVVMFPGWRFLHGVTPLRKVLADGYRLSAVFYTVQKMRDCLPIEEEIARGRADRTNREADLRSADDRLGPRVQVTG